MPSRSVLSPAAAAHALLSPAERQRCEVWTRVMGYHRPVTSFNIGKQGEFLERKYFSESVSQTADGETDQA